MSSNQSNLYIQRLDHVQEAQKQYAELTWRLNFLRTKEAEDPPNPTDEQLCTLFPQTLLRKHLN